MSVSLGSPTRDWRAEVRSPKCNLVIERQGVGQDYVAYQQRLKALDADPTVAAIGLGGINRYFFAGGKKYPLRKAEEMAAVVTRKPLCDGASMKEHWEPYIIEQIIARGVVNLCGANVLMVSAVDRWGMAEALRCAGANLMIGDFMFALGIPIPMRTWWQLELATKSLVPFVSQHVPFEWLYPTGESKDKPKYLNWYRWAEVLAGDYKFIARYMPSEPGSLAGKTVITNTTRPTDVEALRLRGVKLLITTTPVTDGCSFGTNAIAAAASAMAGMPPHEMGERDYLRVFKPLGWHEPRVERLNP